MVEYILFTDGACSGNPGPGAWAYLLRTSKDEKEDAGFVAETTNNRMELQAVIEGLKATPEGTVVWVYSDSAYVVNAFLQNWIGKWQQNNWRRGAKREAVLNRDLWLRLVALTAQRSVRWEKVKGHSNHKENNRVDALAVSAMRAGMKTMDKQQ
jgi:ribonuclease HI